MVRTTVWAGLLGGAAGIGVLLVIAGARVRPQPVRRARHLVHNHARRLLACLAAAVVVGAVTRWPVGALLAAVGAWWLPGLTRGGRSPVARIEAVAAFSEALRDVLSAAAGLEQALMAAASLAPAPIAAPSDRLAVRLRQGDRLADALGGWADEIGDPIADLTTAALVTAAEIQAADLSSLLGELATAAREQAAMRMRLAADRARITSAARIITGATVCLAAGLVLWSRAFLTPYDTATGQGVLLIVGLVFAGGFTWLHRLAHVPEPGRILAPPVGRGRTDSPGRATTNEDDRR